MKPTGTRGGELEQLPQCVADTLNVLRRHAIVVAVGALREVEVVAAQLGDGVRARESLRVVGGLVGKVPMDHKRRYRARLAALLCRPRSRSRPSSVTIAWPLALWSR